MEAINSLRAYVARAAAGQTVSAWHRVPVARRAAVLVLLFLGRGGEWRVVLTRRLARLRSFPGHVLLPGGKADTGLELPWMVAQREAAEEIGLAGAEELARRFGAAYEPVTELPCYLLRTLLAVRPCVAVLQVPPDVRDLGLALNPGESLGIFLVPLRDFVPRTRALEAALRSHRSVKWGGVPWDLRLVTFARDNPDEAPWLRGLDDVDSGSDSESGEGWGNRGMRRNSANVPIYDVWGLTANILHDLARVMEQSHGADSVVGQEDLIYALWRHGHMKLAARLAAELRIISDSDALFGDLLPRAEVVRLRRFYS